MDSCRKTKGTITIEFVEECVMCQDRGDSCMEHDTVDITIHPNENGEPSASPEALIGVLTRAMAAVVTLSAGKNGMAEAYKTSAHVSGFVAEEIASMLEEDYTIKIHIPPTLPAVEA